MNRNLVVGGVVFGLILAALSVGVSTFLVDRSVEAAKVEMQKAASAEDPQVVPVTPDAPAPSVDSFLAVDGAQASDFSASGYVWSKGQLLVTDPEDDSRYLFSVDTTDGVRVYDDNGLTIDKILTVNSKSLMGDVESSGQITATGLVQGATFSNGNGFTVDKTGVVQVAELRATGNSSVDGQLTVNGGLVVKEGQIFQLGTKNSGARVVWDPKTGEFTVVGSLIVNRITTTEGDTVFGSGVTAESFALNSLNGSWDASGTLETKKLIADSLSVGGGKFVVDATTAHLVGSLTVDGDFEADSVTAKTALYGPNGNFRVDAEGINSTGTAQIWGNLNVSGSITGTFTGTFPESGSLTKRDFIARDSLRVGSNPTYVFEVDVDAGTVTARGDLTVAGAADITGDLTVDGAASVAGNLGVTGTVSASNIPNVIRAGTATIAGAPETIAVTGMPATASVVVTPRFAGAAAASADVSAGSFVLDGDDGAYSWIAIW